MTICAACQAPAHRGWRCDGSRYDEDGAPAAPDLGPGGDTHTCTQCGSRRPHTIRRINVQGAPRLCDPCFSERTPQS